MRKKIMSIAICLVILLSGIIGIAKGKNMKPKDQIPQEVINFAKLDKGGELDYQGTWQNYKVYLVSYPELETGVWGLPTYILFDGKDLQWVTGAKALSLDIKD